MICLSQDNVSRHDENIDIKCSQMVMAELLLPCSVSGLLRAQGDLYLSGGPFPMAPTLLGSNAILASLDTVKTFPDGQQVKNMPVIQEIQETWVQCLGQDDPLEEEMVTHTSILAWRVPWTEDPGVLKSTGSQRVGYD